MANQSARRVAIAAAALGAAPTDLGAWLRLNDVLAAARQGDASADGFRRLGEAANGLGQVALAVACARFLDGEGKTESSAALVELIGETHCEGSTRIDSAARPVLPPPRGESSPAPPAPPSTNLETAVAAAAEAIDLAAASAAERAPKSLPPTPLVRVLKVEDFRRLVSVVNLRKQPADRVIVDVGQPARALYWIARGSVEVTRDDVELGVLSSGTFFGEIALVGGTTRTARVRCTEETWLLQIPAASVEEVAGRAPRLAKVLAEYARARLLSNVTRTSELFKRLTEGERRQLLSQFSTRLVAEGDKLIERGKPNDTLFVLVSGRAEVRGPGGVSVATVVPGDGVGEISLLSRKSAVADVVAIEPLAVLGIARSAFDVVAVAHPGLLAEVYKLKVEREGENADLIHDATDLIV